MNSITLFGSWRYPGRMDNVNGLSITHYTLINFTSLRILHLNSLYDLFVFVLCDEDSLEAGGEALCGWTLIFARPKKGGFIHNSASIMCIRI
jgi:hypothetical protein